MDCYEFDAHPERDDLSGGALDSTMQPYDVNDEWLSDADDSEKLLAMELWFHARYWDPANDSPYCRRVG